MEVKLKFNDINVKEEKEKTLVKVLMLKGEKGDTVSAEWGTITGNLEEQTDIKNALDSKANQSDMTNALNQKANASDLNNYYTKSQIDTSFAATLGTQDIVDRLDSTADDKVLAASQGKILNDKLVKKPYYFNTIADLKSSDLQAGDCAITLGYYNANDIGGATYYITSIASTNNYQEELNNGLYATLIIGDYIIPEFFGAKGDGSTDDGQILNQVIQYGYSKKVKVILDKSYSTSVTLLLDKDNLNLEILNRITYTGNNSAIEITGNRNILNINKIYSSGYGITLNCSSSLEANHINVEYISSTNNCIQLLSSTGGNVYNEIRFTTLISTVGYYCIYLYAGTGAYVGENTFYGGKCQRGTWGVYADSNHAGGIPAVKLYNICFEGVKNGVYLNHAQASVINYPRYAELLQVENSILLSVNGDCKDTIFNGNHPITSNRIESNITTPSVTSNRPVIINAPIMDSNGSIIGKKAWCTIVGLSIFPEEIRRVNVTQSKDGTTISKDEYQYAWFDVNYNATMKLNESYIPQVIDTLYIKYDGSTRLILKDYLDNTIHDGTNLSNGIYKITLYKVGTTITYLTEQLSVNS